MTTDAQPSRPWKAWIVAGLASVYAVTLWTIAAPVAPAARVESDPPAPKRSASPPRATARPEQLVPAAHTAARRSPGRVRTRSS